MNIGEKIRLLRESKKMSQELLGEKIGVSRQAVTKWELGESLPDVNNFIELSKIFNVSLDKLLKNDNCVTELIEEKNIIKFNECIEFLVEAKKNTYAGDGKVNDISMRPCSKDLEYVKDDYKYIDTYLGGENFIGEEAVFYLDKPIWGMNYYGKEYEKFSVDFLRKAMLTVTKENPYRGQPIFKDGDYTYICEVNGDFEHFNGTEKIYFEKKIVFECIFNGGIIK